MTFRIWYPILAFAALSIGASWALSGCASDAEFAAAQEDVALGTIHHEWAVINGWPDIADQLMPPAKFDYEPAGWKLAIVDDDITALFCARQLRQYPGSRVVACSVPLTKTTMFSRSFATPAIQAIAAQHAPGKP